MFFPAGAAAGYQTGQRFDTACFPHPVSRDQNSCDKTDRTAPVSVNMHSVFPAKGQGRESAVHGKSRAPYKRQTASSAPWPAACLKRSEY